MTDDGPEGARRGGNDADGEAALAGFRQSSQFLCVVQGPDLRVAAINEAGAALVGSRALGTTFHEAFADIADQQVHEMLERCYTTGQAAAGGEWRVRRDLPGGGTAEAHLDFSVTPWRGVDGRVIGVIGEGREIGDGVRTRQAHEARTATAERHLADARLLVQTMQDELLPQALPVLPRLDVAARYLLAVEDTASGGDWFDAVVRPDGRVALVVGDVVGHGTTASATMGQLRAVCHERLGSTASLPRVLRDVDRFARVLPEARQATLCVVELDTASGLGTYCTAGHPPPLVLVAGRAAYLSPTGAGPLATTGRFPLADFALESEGDLVVLYSDGLIERPGTTPAASTVELAATAQGAANGRPAGATPRRTAERLCQITLAAMTRTTGYNDDITILAVQRTRPPTRLQVTLPATVAHLSTARERLNAWLDEIDVRQLDRIAVVHAVSELLANAAVHAYAGRAGGGDMTLEADLTDDGTIRVVVSDRGRWQVPTDATTDPRLPGGRGLHMSDVFLDSLRVTPSDTGTTAVGTVRPSRPAVLMAAPPHALPPRVEPPFEAAQDADVLVVRGPVFGLTADQLDRHLRRVIAAGTVPAVIDLSGVTHLGSTAVRLFHDVITTNGHDVTLVAPNGTVAQHVLDLVQLPHRPGPDGPPRGAVPAR